jgi:hypothetical protein
MAVGKDSDVYRENIKALQKYQKELEEKLANYTSLVSSPEEQSLYENVKKAWKEYLEISEKAISIGEKKKYESAFDEILIQGRPKIAELESAISKLAAYNYDGGIDSTHKGNGLTFLTIATMGVIIVVSILVTLIILSMIKNSTGSLGQAINNLKNQSSGTKKISTDLKKSSQNLADSVAEQASSVHETSAAINEITSMLNKTAENAKESKMLRKMPLKKQKKVLELWKTLSMPWKPFSSPIINCKILQISSIKLIQKQLSSTTLFQKQSFFHSMPVLNLHALGNMERALPLLQKKWGI